MVLGCHNQRNLLKEQEILPHSPNAKDLGKRVGLALMVNSVVPTQLLLDFGAELELPVIVAFTARNS